MSRDIAAALAAPFDAKDLKTRPGRSGMTYTYADVRAIDTRLDEVFGTMGWSFSWEVVDAANDGIERVAALYAEKQYESKLLDQELQNLAISLKEAIGEKAGVYGEGWQATWKQNKPTVKTDWEAVAEVAKAVAPDTYELALKTHTVEKPGARVFRFKTEEVDK